MKFKLPPLFSEKPKKKLRATAVRKPLRIAATAEYDEMAEPNMKLSRALLIVLLLHVVAVSGIIAFNAIKTRQVNDVRPSANVSATRTADEKASSAPRANLVSSKETGSPRVESKATHAAEKTSAREERKAEHPRSLPESGKSYTVEKGDTPLKISRKFKVPFDDLLAVNHIDDPHKLQVGQKLIIPSKPKPKKSE